MPNWFLMGSRPGGGGGGLNDGLGPTNKFVQLAPNYPGAGAGTGGSTHTNYQVGVAPAATSPDEAFYAGYNVQAATATEPGSKLVMETDFATTIRGIAGIRTMETYLAFVPRPTDGDGIEHRPLFYAFDTADTTQGHHGEIAYGWNSTGFNRHSHGLSGVPGGYQISTDAGAGNSQLNGFTVPHAIFDVDGTRLNFLRACQDIAAISAVSGAVNNVVLTVPAPHNINVGAKIQIFKPVTAGWQSLWNAGAKVVGTVTATTSTTLTTNINNTTLGIIAGYGYELAIPATQYFSPAFQLLTVGTSYSSGGIPFTSTVAGSHGIIGVLDIADTGFPTADFGTFTYPGLLNFLSSDPGTGGKHQVLTFNNSGIQHAFGFPNDGSANNYDSFMTAFGPANTTDANFSLANAIITFFTTGGATDNSVGIAGVESFTPKVRLAIGGGNATYGHMNLNDAGADKAAPGDGDLWRNGNAVAVNAAPVNKSPFKIRVAGVTYQLLCA